MKPGGLPWYAVNSVFAPRAAARQLMAETSVPAISWRIAAMGLIATFLSLWLINAAFFKLAPLVLAPDHFIFAQSQAGVLFEALLFAAVTAAMIVATIFVWKFVFGYREPDHAKHGALAAAALAFGMSVIVAPVTELAFALMHQMPGWAQATVWAGSAFFILFIPAYFYCEIFKIDLMPSMLLNVAALMITALPMVLVLLPLFYVLY
jgi:uncharacterized membrane protein YjfL (UPF0719 family)